MMQRTIELRNKKITYMLKVSKRARNIRLAIYPGGNFVVTTPYFVHQQVAENFIVKKSEWVLQTIDHAKTLEPILPRKSKKAEYLKYKNAARELVEQKIKQFNQVFQYKVNRINIKNQKTRWGSCSRKGNINFNYKIVFLPEKTADYIIVHELCHLVHFNHSQKFWDLVAKTIPDYRAIKNELRKNSLRVG